MEVTSIWEANMHNSRQVSRQLLSIRKGTRSLWTIGSARFEKATLYDVRWDLAAMGAFVLLTFGASVLLLRAGPTPAEGRLSSSGSCG